MKQRKKPMKVIIICLAIIVVPIIIKAIWVGIATRHNGDFESEEADIMARPGRILPLLQRREDSPEPWIQDTRKLLSPSERGGLTQKEIKSLSNEKQFVYLQR